MISQTTNKRAGLEQYNHEMDLHDGCPFPGYPVPNDPCNKRKSEKLQEVTFYDQREA